MRSAVRADTEESLSTGGPENRPLLGISLKIISVLTMLVMWALVKYMSAVPMGQTVFFRATFALIPLAIVLAWSGQLRDGLKTRMLGSHMVRGLVGVAAMTCVFLSLRNLPLPDATSIHYATPLVIVVLSALILKERVRIFRWTAVLIGVSGVVIIVWPNLSLPGGIDGESGRMFGVVTAMAGALLAGFAQILVRNLTRTESSATIVLYFSLTASLFSLFTLPFGWIVPSATELAILVLIGILGGVGQIIMTQSYRYADLSVVAPFEYSSLIFSIIAGYLIFAEVPTPHMLIGGGVVTAAGLAIILREHRQAQTGRSDRGLPTL